jgi:hypothetical protein
VGAVTLVEFLRARLDEDEQVARAAFSKMYPRSAEWSASGMQVRTNDPLGGAERPGTLVVQHSWPNEIEHIARHDPARVLAEVAAKRQIIDAYLEERSRRDIYQSADARAAEDAGVVPGQAIQRRASAALCRGLEIAVERLALPYADHADYRPEWAP